MSFFVFSKENRYDQMVNSREEVISVPFVKLYMKKNCSLCNEVRDLLSLFEVKIVEIDIEIDPALLEKYMLEIPVIDIGGEKLDYRSIDYSELEKRLH